MADFSGLAGDIIEQSKTPDEKEYRQRVSKRITGKSTGTEDVAIITLFEKQLVSAGNMFVLIAPPGTGKSNIGEGISSSAENGDCDTFGFKVSLPEGKKVLLCDTERTNNDCIKGFNRIIRRTKTDPVEMKDGEFEKIIFLSFIASESFEESRKDIEEIVESGEVGLLILDGIGDFISSVNDEEKSKEVVRWLIVLANKYGLGIMVTIHPNPKDASYKPTGHLGSFLLKKAEAVMVVCKADNNTRLVTTNFEHGKVRNAYDVLETAIEWSDAHGMFMTADVVSAKNKNEKGKKIDELMKKIFALKPHYIYGDLLDMIKKERRCKDTAANSMITQALELNIIKEHRNTYSLNDMDSDDEVPF